MNEQFNGNNNMFCPNCGYKVAGQNFCPNCGNAMNNMVSSNIYNSPNSNMKFSNVQNYRKTNKTAILVSSIVAVILLLTVLLLVPTLRYSTANSYMHDGNYMQAVTIFEKLGSFRDSENKKLECFYKLGLQYENEGKYDDAAKAFEKSKGYKDASEKKKEAEQEAKVSDLKKKFVKAYKKCLSNDTSLSSDGLSITVNSANEYDTEGGVDIMMIISSLKLPNSLLDEMLATNSLMGRQSEKYENIQVDWSYHPDNGLDAIFKIVE